MLCGRVYFLAGWIRRGFPARIAQGGLFRRTRSSSSRSTKSTQVPYPATVNLAEGYGRYSFRQVRQLETAGRLIAKVALIQEPLRLSISFDISFDYGMLRISYNFILKVSIPKFLLGSNLSLV
ncbi:hypothetical protein M9H77_02536 [Catharanthus roseus]|uniref:Uncharacterized protein n=1 Tax=Catharanthus roseus TaxID=4058 RepID=A0ACC0C8T4_CATRO|nr:hypothetical protein M9H77_02536 [Catharanthus roseus]